VEAQPLAQPDQDAAAAILDDVALGHLRLRTHLLVQAVQRVPDEVAVVAGDVGGGDDRVEHAEVGDGREAQHPRRLRQPRPREEGGAGYCHEVPPAHPVRSRHLCIGAGGVGATARQGATSRASA
jgi:hypothetical protein